MLAETTTLQIRTPEGVEFSLPLATPLSRALAWWIDVLAIGGISIALNLILGLFKIVAPDWSTGLQAMLFLAVTLGYGSTFEWLWRGQTPGKKALGIRVVDERGLPLRFGQVVIRNVVRFIDSLPFFYGVGGAAVLFTRHCQRLGDLAGGTVVMRAPKIRPPNLQSLLTGQYNSFRDHPIVENRLRQKSPPAAAHLALSALLRRDELEPMHRLTVFRALADHFRALAPFPAETTASLTDEQYLRNVVDTLFRKRGR